MNLLLDTHAFLWFVGGCSELSATARQRIPAGSVEMPTVLNVGPYRFFFVSLDYSEPPHVHVRRRPCGKVLVGAGCAAKGGRLQPIRIEHNRETGARVSSVLLGELV